LPSASGVEALNMARQQLDRDILLDDFIARLGNDEDYRARASAHIGVNAIGKPRRPAPPPAPAPVTPETPAEG
ncbi:MAG: hypothetical protein AAF684_05005, partial [Pseudomonadota bacterium]